MWINLKYGKIRQYENKFTNESKGEFMAKILIVEDDPTIRNGLVNWLSRSGFKIVEAEDGQIAIDALKRDKFDIVILDIMLPRVDGYGVLKMIRSELNEWLPVIMLTAKAQEDDKILGLDLGADDYMVKPFSNRELEARIKANLRKKSALEVDDNVSTELFEIDNQKYQLRNGDLSVDVTRKEMDLLKILIKFENEYIEKVKLLESVWGYLDSNDTRTLDIHISKLRKKLEKINITDVIKTKRGVGYSFMVSK